MGTAMSQCCGGCNTLYKDQQAEDGIPLGDLQDLQVQIARLQIIGCEDKDRECCPLWSRCIKYMESIHYLLDPKDVEEALVDPKAHWDSLEES